MAGHGEIEYATAAGNDYAAHEQTYRGFVRLLKIAIGVAAVVLILMGIFLT